MQDPEQTPPAGGSRLPGAAGQTRAFLLAVGFLTRMPLPLRASPEELSASVPYYPLVGALLGVLLCLPVWLGLFPQQPWVQAWLYALLSAWITRALHLDGLADILDALGSGKTGTAFREILKDSRIGAFGVAGLMLAMGGQIILAAELLHSGRVAPLFFAPLYGRCLPIALASLSAPYPSAGLGALLAGTAKGPALTLAAACGLCAGAFCLSWPSFALCLALTACLLVFLTRLSRREGGYSGDFLGFSIVAGEIAALLAAVAG